MFVDGILERIDASSPLAQTLSGLRVGDPASRVYSVYGRNIEATPNFYDPEHSEYLTYIPDDPKDRTRVIFDTTNDEVVNIRAGNLPAIGWIEGCA